MTMIIMLGRYVAVKEYDSIKYIYFQDNNVRLKCIATDMQVDYVKQCYKDDKKGLYLLTGYYIRINDSYAIKISSIKKHNFDDMTNICNINNPNYITQNTSDFVIAKEKAKK